VQGSDGPASFPSNTSPVVATASVDVDDRTGVSVQSGGVSTLLSRWPGGKSVEVLPLAACVPPSADPAEKDARARLEPVFSWFWCFWPWETSWKEEDALCSVLGDMDNTGSAPSVVLDVGVGATADPAPNEPLDPIGRKAIGLEVCGGAKSFHPAA